MSNVRLINKTVRSFNGIRPNEVVEVNEVNLPTYLSFGFEKLSTETVKKTEAPVVEKGLTNDQIKAKLKELGVDVPKGANKEILEKLLKEATEKTTEDTTGIEGFKQLLTDNAVPFVDTATIEELKALCEENGLI